MVFRLPTNFLGRATLSNGMELLGDEIIAEQASALGHQGRRVERALKALREEEEGDREPLLNEAAAALWAYLVQRELVGLRDQHKLLRELEVPKEVINRLGTCR